MISFSRFRHQLIYSSFSFVIIVDDRRAQLFNVVVLDDSRVIIIERRWLKRSSRQDYHCCRFDFKHMRLSCDTYFIKLWKIYYSDENFKQYILSLIYWFQQTKIFSSIIIYFSFSILLKSLRITRSELCDVSTSISDTIQTYCDDSTRIMLDQFEDSSQYRLMNVT
jgi:hypothetical protein